jgi:hypothetical protein
MIGLAVAVWSAGSLFNSGNTSAVKTQTEELRQLRKELCLSRGGEWDDWNNCPILHSAPVCRTPPPNPPMTAEELKRGRDWDRAHGVRRPLTFGQSIFVIAMILALLVLVGHTIVSTY